MDAAASSPEATTILVEHEQETSTTTERLREANERLETRISMIRTRIHRFPHRLRGIGGAGDRYIVPSVVAIGPYHHGLPHLQEMEEVKQAAAYRLCRASGHSVEEVYDKILSVAGDARRCYGGGDDAPPLVAGLSDAEFATMMFLDGCFLVWYLGGGDADEDDSSLLFAGLVLSSEPNIDKDIFMLENQIPWLVLHALMEITNKDVRYVHSRPWELRPQKEKKRHWRRLLQWRRRRLPPDPPSTADEDIVTRSNVHITEDYRPPHLLGLLRSILIRSMPPEKREGKFTFSASTPLTTTSRTAFELAQIGIKLTASTARWFADMNCHKKPFVLGELSLSPLYLTDVTTSWLVNMAALESVEATAADSFGKDGYVISSYLSILAMLMDQEEDAQELRRSGVIKTNFTNTETLAFFKGLGQHLRLGINYYNILAEIDTYIRERPIMIAVHKFIYNNYRYIVALLSIASVLVGIFKALYSLKKP